MSYFTKPLIASILVVASGFAMAQSSMSGNAMPGNTMPGHAQGAAGHAPATMNSMPAAQHDASTTTMQAAPGAMNNMAPAATTSAAVSSDPYVAKRNADAAAKKEYKEKRRAAKAEYKHEKADAKAEMKMEKKEAATERKEALADDKSATPTGLQKPYMAK